VTHSVNKSIRKFVEVAVSNSQIQQALMIVRKSNRINDNCIFHSPQLTLIGSNQSVLTFLIFNPVAARNNKVGHNTTLRTTPAQKQSFEQSAI